MPRCSWPGETIYCSCTLLPLLLFGLQSAPATLPFLRGKFQEHTLEQIQLWLDRGECTLERLLLKNHFIHCFLHLKWRRMGYLWFIRPGALLKRSCMVQLFPHFIIWSSQCRYDGFLVLHVFWIYSLEMVDFLKQRHFVVDKLVELWSQAVAVGWGKSVW